jgi:HEAT repeat protein
VRAIALLGTPAAHRALLSLAMDPPKVAYAEDLVINAIHGLDEALDGSRSLHELLLDTCESKADHPRVSQPMIALFNAADAPGALKDKRLHALLRKALSDPNLVEARSQAIYVLKKQNDAESLPPMVATLDRLGPNDGSSLVHIASFMYELRQVDAKGLAKVRAARARLAEPLASYDDRTLERLAELVES